MGGPGDTRGPPGFKKPCKIMKNLEKQCKVLQKSRFGDKEIFQNWSTNQLGNRFQSKKTSRWVWNATFSLKKAFYGSEKAPKELQEGFLEAPREAQMGATDSNPPASQRPRPLGSLPLTGRADPSPSADRGDDHQGWAPKPVFSRTVKE